MRLPDPASVRINVEFINEFGLNESGMDYGAMFKEFALKVCEAAFNPETGLFKVSEVIIILGHGSGETAVPKSRERGHYRQVPSLTFLLLWSDAG